MKKNLTIIASAVLALGMLFVTGCKNASNLGDDTSNAGSNVIGANYKLRITAEDYPIDWWVLTDTNNVVLQQGKEIKSITYYNVETDTAGNDASGTYDIDIESGKNIKTGETVEVTFNENYFDSTDTQKETRIYINQKDRTLKYKNGNVEEEKKGYYTSVASVKVSTQTGRKTTDKKIVQAKGSTRAPVATVLVTCDETGNRHNTAVGQTVNLNGTNCTIRKWHGNYRINHLWPMVWDNNAKTEGGQAGAYVAYQGLKFNNLNVEEGNSIEVIYPAEAPSFFSIKQEDRFTTEDNKAAQEQDKYYWCFATQLSKYTKRSVKSSICEYKFNGDKVYDSTGKTEVTIPGSKPNRCITAAYFIDPSEFVEAADEK